jgi:hypothetical protein
MADSARWAHAQPLTHTSQTFQLDPLLLTVCSESAQQRTYGQHLGGLIYSASDHMPHIFHAVQYLKAF